MPSVASFRVCSDFGVRLGADFAIGCVRLRFFAVSPAQLLLQGSGFGFHKFATLRGVSMGMVVCQFVFGWPLLGASTWVWLSFEMDSARFGWGLAWVLFGFGIAVLGDDSGSAGFGCGLAQEWLLPGGLQLRGVGDHHFAKLFELCLEWGGARFSLASTIQGLACV